MQWQLRVLPCCGCDICGGLRRLAPPVIASSLITTITTIKIIIAFWLHSALTHCKALAAQSSPAASKYARHTILTERQPSRFGVNRSERVPALMGLGP